MEIFKSQYGSQSSCVQCPFTDDASKDRDNDLVVTLELSRSKASDLKSSLPTKSYIFI